jgi:SpoVK/Ycf46/Vps4 family AAA+-type ATPase
MEELDYLFGELENSDNRSEIYYEIALIHFNEGRLKSCVEALSSCLLEDQAGRYKYQVSDFLKHLLPYLSDEVDMREPVEQLIDRSVTFKDVGGLAEIKKAIEMKIIKPFKNPDLFTKFRKKSGGGVLLYGPPGCGKTFLAKATAGECNAHFINVSITDILDPYLGVSERNIRAIFEEARKQKPCVLFFDEIDSLGYKRSRLRGETVRTVIDEFLSQLQGFNTDNEGVLIIGATNMPWDVDEAFKRPGRFDKLLLVSPPDLEARKEIFKLKTQDLDIKGIDYDQLASSTELYSGADIQNVIELASEYVISDILETGIERDIRMKDIELAIVETTPSTLEWISTVKNIIKFSDNKFYDEVRKFIKKHKL